MKMISLQNSQFAVIVVDVPVAMGAMHVFGTSEHIFQVNENKLNYTLMHIH